MFRCAGWSLLPVVAVCQNGLPGNPEDTLPGVMTILSNGVDLTSGDVRGTTRGQVFSWTWDLGQNFNNNGINYKYPDQMTIDTSSPDCNWKQSATSRVATSFSESMDMQSKSHGAGLSFHLPVEGLEAIKNSMSFGNSKLSQQFNAQYSNHRSLATTSRVRSSVYRAQVSTYGLTDAVFHPNFKNAVLTFASTPTKEEAFNFFEAYGTHFIHTAAIGGEAYRNAFYSTNTTASAAEHLQNDKEEDSFKFLWVDSHKSSSSTEFFAGTDGLQCSVYNEATDIVGGDPSAPTKGDFCKSVEDLINPAATEYSKLVPLWEFFDKIDGVNADAAAIMNSHLMDMVEDGRLCALNTCQFPFSICKYDADNRAWLPVCVNIKPEPQVKLFNSFHDEIGTLAGVGKCMWYPGQECENGDNSKANTGWDHGVYFFEVGPGAVVSLANERESQTFSSPGSYDVQKYFEAIPYDISVLPECFEEFPTGRVSATVHTGTPFTIDRTWALQGEGYCHGCSGGTCHTMPGLPGDLFTDDTCFSCGTDLARSIHVGPNTVAEVRPRGRENDVGVFLSPGSYDEHLLGQYGVNDVNVVITKRWPSGSTSSTLFVGDEFTGRRWDFEGYGACHGLTGGTCVIAVPALADGVVQSDWIQFYSKVRSIIVGPGVMMRVWNQFDLPGGEGVALAPGFYNLKALELLGVSSDLSMIEQYGLAPPPAPPTTTPTPPPPPAPPTTTPVPVHGEHLNRGDQLRSGETLVSPAGVQLKMQGDGNLVIRNSAGDSVWSTRTDGHDGAHLTFQSADGNLVVRTPSGTSVWSSGEHSGAASAAIQDDCNFVVKDPSGYVLWSTGTSCGFEEFV